MSRRHDEIITWLRCIDRDVDKILDILSKPTDFSKEDADVLAATKKSAEAKAAVDTAKSQIPPPKTTNQEGK